MDQIQNLTSEQDIQEGDIWQRGPYEYTISNIGRRQGLLRCTTTRTTPPGGSNGNYQVRAIFNDVNFNGTRHCIKRDNQDNYRRVECENGCGSFVLTPGEKYRQVCGVCR